MRRLIVRVLAAGCILVAHTVGIVWAASIEGEKFIVRPWLAATVFKAEKVDKSKYAVVRLGCQFENMSETPLTITGMKLEWDVSRTDHLAGYYKYGSITLEQTGGPPFDQVGAGSHESAVFYLDDMNSDPVELKVPPGQYSYSIAIRNPDENSRVELSSNIIFEVNS